MNFQTLRIATRNSRLAMYQAKYVSNKLKQYYPNIKIQFIPIITTGDKLSNTAMLQNRIIKGAFIKELEYALIKHQADIAVHSMKDITVPLPDTLILPAICKRDDPRDAFVSIQYDDFNKLPTGGIVGTSSLRRQCQIRLLRPDLTMNNLRGNIDTRIKKLCCGEYDAIILAVAGLNRLQLTQYIRVYIDPADLLPAMGQGVIAVECRVSDTHIMSLLSPLHHQETAFRVQSEKAFTTYLEGYCQFPIASYSEIQNNQIWLRVLIGLPHDNTILRAEGKAPLCQSEKLGLTLAKKILTQLKNHTV